MSVTDVLFCEGRHIMKKLLLVIDMQNDFINGSLGTPEAVSVVEKVKKKTRSSPPEAVIAETERCLREYAKYNNFSFNKYVKYKYR